MIHVCFMESGKQYLLVEFETLTEAEEFIKHDAVLYYADEINEDEDVVIAKERMFIEKEGCKCMSL